MADAVLNTWDKIIRKNRYNVCAHGAESLGLGRIQVNEDCYYILGRFLQVNKTWGFHKKQLVE